MGGHIPGSLHKVGYMEDDRTAHDKAYCSFGEGTAKGRAQYTEHRAVHMGSCIYCGRSDFRMVPDKGGNHECRAPCTCESKSGDAHTCENMDDGIVPDNTGHRYHDTYGHILTDDHSWSYIQDHLSVFCKSMHLAGCGRTLDIR